MKSSASAVFVALFAAMPSAPAQTGHVEFDQLDAAIIAQRVGNLSRKVVERRATLEKLFQESGCTGDSLTSQKVRGSKEPNVICKLKGQNADAGVIVVGGHFDLADQGMGAVDDWSGAVLLPSLYESFEVPSPPT